MLKLPIEYSYDFHLIGVISSLKEYKLAYHLNKLFNWRLYKVDDVIFTQKKESYEYSCYEYVTENVVIMLLKNRCNVFENLSSINYLLPEQKKYDYLIKIENEEYETENDDIVSKLQEVANISLIKTIEIDKLKNRENLIFDYATKKS